MIYTPDAEPRRWRCSEPARCHSCRTPLRAFTAFPDLGSPPIHGEARTAFLCKFLGPGRLATARRIPTTGLGRKPCRHFGSTPNCPYSVVQAIVVGGYGSRREVPMKSESLALRIRAGQTLAGTVSLLRRATHLPMNHLSAALQAGTPILIVDEWANCPSERRAEVIELFDQVCASGAACEAWLGAEQVPRSFLENQVVARKETERETEMIMELESGTSSTEALAWQAEALKK